MDTFQKEYINLIRSAFTDEAISPSAHFDWAKAVDTAKKHNIVPIIFYGSVNCNISKDFKYMQELHLLTLRSMMFSERQAYEIKQIENVFEKENIDYMPLKGAVLKSLYPHPEMRTMGDADILIKMEQYSEIECLLSQLGFTFQYESDHELVWKKATLFLELHKSIMTTYNKDFFQYFGNGWKTARKISNSCRHEMTSEDFYIYIFVHFTKHYRISGIGIKHLLDLWVYANAHPDLNWNYIKEELEKMRLQLFHENILKTIHVWFDNETATEKTDVITNVIFSSGQYGSADLAVINRALRSQKGSVSGIKISNFFQRLFLPYRDMKQRYQILERIPFLLPIMWLVRCFDILLFRKDTIKKHANEMKLINSDQLEENAQALHFVGLDFNYKK